MLDHQLGLTNAALAAEVTAREADTAAATAALATESAARIAADVAQGQEIDRIEAGAGLETDGTFLAPTGSNYLNAATSLKDASLKLDSALKGVSDDTAQLKNVTVPALTTAVANEVSRATTAEADLQAQINSVGGSGSAGITALKSAINASVFRLKTTVAALVHTVNHGLASEFLEFQVMVQGSDGIFRNDIVPVEESGTSTLVVTLSEAANIKIVVRRADAIV